MNNEPVIVERTYNAPIDKVWSALIDIEKLNKWYFKLSGFKPEIGYEFSFEGGKDNRVYVHLCKVIEITEKQKLTYSWRYKGYPGDSFVTWELFDEGNSTRVILTHTGLETLAAGHADFARENFNAGWTSILGKSFKNYLETVPI